ncbi:arylamine N-acetyltransferase family protein [Fluoribacter gormanii]|uniref:N-hydroxyarylamine O-acetyltransferase n=1 Tax=Fluoribacter gormanii TaxID=464 RepID=A0A377GN77_9GAMM|nr:arylamine N-acetyltransferase [Fluoribacter gormanii]KTD05238.1 putative N-hydroxyarylamine O-acetyltransferase [Fluoribacter gormanii]SIR00644.1 N-hydroxyarylamine O-acetyltransferase [Fluoribacter gormanii]STO26063.1 N-hydroxyarylamine O-acetyltransferase [Fluoribacter gormanii]
MNKINLEEYLQKVKVIVPPSLGEAACEEKINFLNSIYLAHVKTFPYSNFELRKISKQHLLQRNSLSFFCYKNLLSEEPGGYCFQIAALLFDALSQLGYDVTFCAARVLLGATPNDHELLKLPPTHLVLTVQIDDQKFLLDPGLGSSAPRFPVPITGTNESISQNEDEYKFYSIDNVHVLEKKTRLGWFRLMQTDLVPISEKQAAMNLLKLGRHPAPIGIRDSKTVIGIITEHGRKSLIWDAQSKQLKYSANESTEYTQKTITSFAEGHQILATEFDIKHVSVEALEAYCTGSVPLPIKPWTINFPLDHFELNEMEKNLRPAF